VKDNDIDIKTLSTPNLTTVTLYYIFQSIKKSLPTNSDINSYIKTLTLRL